MEGSSSNTPSLDMRDHAFLSQPKDLQDGKMAGENNEPVGSFHQVPAFQAKKEGTDNKMEMGFSMRMSVRDFDFSIVDGNYLELNDLLTPLSPPTTSSDITSYMTMDSGYQFDEFASFSNLDDDPVITTEEAAGFEVSNCSEGRNPRDDAGRKGRKKNKGKGKGSKFRFSPF